MKKEVEEFLEETFGDILSDHWHRVLNVRELEETNTGNPLRVKSIKDRKAELKRTEDKFNAFILLHEDYAVIPDWYKEVTTKHGIKPLELP